MKLPAALAPIQARWYALGHREQALLSAAAWLIGLLLVWSLLVLPPLRTLGQADAQRRSLDAQLQKRQTLAAQSRALQSQPKLSRDEALRALESSVKQGLGTGGQLNVVGDRATVTLRSVPAEALAQWLMQARVNARATPSEARLVRGNAANPSGGAAGAPAAVWDGTLVMSLPSS